MRIGEIKSIIKNVLNDSQVIELKSEEIYGGQAYKVNNYNKIISALDVLSEQKWNTADYSQVESVKSQHQSSKEPVDLSVDEFNLLNSYVNTINPQVPMYYSILESLVLDQDEKTINIQLPTKVTSLNELSIVNRRLMDILKLFNVDGQFDFKGFDTGTDWYVLAAAGPMSCGFLIACLKIAQEYFKARTEYFKSEKARLSFEASRSSTDKFTEKDFGSYKRKWLKLYIENEVKKAVKKFGTKGQTEAELQNQLVKATTKLIKELKEGTEFHLSLNPPSYASEQGGELKIDYTKIKEYLPSVNKTTKALEDGGGNAQSEESEKK